MSDVLTHNDGIPISDIKIPAGQKGYDTVDWNDIPMYVCNACGADTFNEDLVKAHIERLHRERKGK
jgi:hypothetical protein